MWRYGARLGDDESDQGGGVIRAVVMVVQDGGNE